MLQAEDKEASFFQFCYIFSLFSRTSPKAAGGDFVKNFLARAAETRPQTCYVSLIVQWARSSAVRAVDS